MPERRTIRIVTAPPVAGRPATAAEARARLRAGNGPGKPGSEPVWEQARNGLPEFAPYTYQGTGTDELTPWMNDGPGVTDNCVTCELWLGCGGAFCASPLQRGGPR